MRRIIPTPIVAGALALCVMVAGGASTALALDAPGGPTTSPATPSRSSTWTFSWTAPTADADRVISGYQGGLDGAVADLGTGGSATLTVPEGSHTFRVRAVQTPTDGSGAPEPGPFSTVTVRVDTTAPAITARVPSPNGRAGWYRSPFTVSFTCTDPSTIVTCGPNRSFTADPRGTDQGTWTVKGTGTDILGNSRTIAVGPLHVDMLAPADALLSTPGVDAVTAEEPTFTWKPNRSGETSGYEHYEVQVLLSGNWRTLASVPYQRNPHGGIFSAVRDRRLMAKALDERTPLQWRVATWDNAGNSKGSRARSFTIDSTAPAKPVITSGPSGPVRQTTPTFSWSGDQPSFRWSVTMEGEETPAQSGSGDAATVTLEALPDGDYVFSGSQVSAALVVGVEATRAFTVDTVAPPPPTITVHPPLPTTSSSPEFAWVGEPGSSFRWQVLNAAGGSAQSPVETPLGSTTVGPFTPGSYTFRVSQIDPAGNVSGAATDPFTIAGAVLAAVAKPTVAKLPAVRASRLRPKANRTVMTRRPTLSWAKGPRGTRLYNVQVFRAGRKGTSSTKVTKVFSRFPKARHLRLPKSKIRPGYCYVWRVWPYVKKGFTSKPLGVSNFCVGTPAQINAKAKAKAKAKARAKARARAKAKAKAKTKAVARART